MKYLLTFIVFVTVSFAENTYGYGNIDMHGGKKDSLINKQNSGFGNKDMGVSNFLDEKEKKKETDIKKEKKVKQYR